MHKSILAITFSNILNLKQCIIKNKLSIIVINIKFDELKCDLDDNLKEKNG